MTSEVAAASTETSRLARVDPMSRGRDGLHVEDMVNFPRSTKAGLDAKTLCLSSALKFQ